MTRSSCVHVVSVLLTLAACGAERPDDATVGGGGGSGGSATGGAGGGGATKPDDGGAGGAGGGAGGGSGSKQDAAPSRDTRPADRPADKKQGETNPEFPPCTTNAECPKTHYCQYGPNGQGCRATDPICSPRKVDIYCNGDPTGFCVKRYTSCVPAATMACGCDGKTYESTCVMIKDYGMNYAANESSCEGIPKL